MTARVITTLLRLHRPMQSCIVVMTLAVIMGRGRSSWGGGAHHASQKDETHLLATDYQQNCSMLSPLHQGRRTKLGGPHRVQLPAANQEYRGAGGRPASEEIARLPHPR